MTLRVVPSTPAGPPSYEDGDPGPFGAPSQEAVSPPTQGPRLLSACDQDVANELIRTLAEKHGAPPVYTDGSLWNYDGAGVWVQRSEHEVRNIVCAWNGAPLVDAAGRPRFRGKTPLTFPGNQRNAESALKRTCDIARDDAFFNDSMSGVMFRDRFVKVTEMGEIEECDPSAECRASFRIDAPYPKDPFALPEDYVELMFNAFSSEDKEAMDKIRLIQEWFGLAMIGRSPNARALFLVGPERSGKSVTAKVALGVFPPSVRAAIPLKSLDPSSSGGSKSEYYLAQLAGVRINADLDLPSGQFVGGENFKKIVTGEGMTGRHPSGKSFTFTPRAAMLFAGESLPNPEDKNRGFFRRWLVVRYHKQVKIDAVRQNYEDVVLAKERATIAAWFVHGAAASIKRGGFDIPNSVAAETPKWVMDSDHVAQWCAAHCIPAPNMPRSMWQPASVFLAPFSVWNRANNYKERSSSTFGKDLKRCLSPELWYEDGNGVTRWGYRYESGQSTPATGAKPGDEFFPISGDKRP